MWFLIHVEGVSPFFDRLGTATFYAVLTMPRHGTSTTTICTQRKRRNNDD